MRHSIDLTLFIMHVEDEFLIAVPDDVSDAVRTVGDLHRAVVKALGDPLQFGGDTPAHIDDVWPKLVGLIRQRVGNDALDVSPATALAEVFPPGGDGDGI